MEGLWGELLTALFSVAASYGAVTAKVKHMEKELEDFRKDHDLIIRLDTKMDTMSDTLRELRDLIENKRSKK